MSQVFRDVRGDGGNAGGGAGGGGSPRNNANETCSGASSPRHPERMDTMKQKVSRGGTSPRAYQQIDIFPQREAEQHSPIHSHNSRSSIGSLDSMRGRKFACLFDPAVKNGRALVMKFDIDGVGTFQEVTRLDLLRMTQDAAKPNVDLTTAAAEEEEYGGVTSPRSEQRGPMRRIKARRPSVRRMFGEPADATPYASICDVQVRELNTCRKGFFRMRVCSQPPDPLLCSRSACPCSRHPQIG